MIEDFSAAEGDKIDLGELISTVHFIGTAAFTGVAGQVRYEYIAASNHALVDVVLTGNVTLTAGDFLV